MTNDKTPTLIDDRGSLYKMQAHGIWPLENGSTITFTSPKSATFNRAMLEASPKKPKHHGYSHLNQTPTSPRRRSKR